MAEEQTVDHATETVEQATEKTFSQEDVTRISTKEHKSGYSKAIKDLGFSDVESAKNALAEYAKWQESQKSEADKQAEALTAKDKELANAQAENKILASKLAALSKGVNADAVDDVNALAERLVADDVSIDDAIGQVLAKYPQFGKQEPVEEKKPTITVPGNPSAQNSLEITKEQFDKMTYNERVELKQENPTLFNKLAKGD
ncbi:hypothetical protein [Streptococcus suis]|uniref:hypothetical protein n=1 Tax=Streptococcus suis TaxID=1307 RepID=UPI0015D4E575|nr:hypothetical protein [Streptococcus suis]